MGSAAELPRGPQWEGTLLPVKGSRSHLIFLVTELGVPRCSLSSLSILWLVDDGAIIRMEGHRRGTLIRTSECKAELALASLAQPKM